MAEYLPSTDDGLRNWAVNFSTLITATPLAYGVTSADAATIAGAVNLFTAALTLVVDPATKTKATVADKNAKKAAMKATLRFYAQLIKRNNGVTNEEKVALGLHIDDNARSPIPAPTTQPVCSVVAAAALQHTLRLADITTPNKRAKPAGVTGAYVYLFVAPAGTTPPVNPTLDKEAEFYGVATRDSFTVELPPEEVGKTATYYVRWVTRTGLVGPWSEPTSKMIAA